MIFIILFSRSLIVLLHYLFAAYCLQHSFCLSNSNSLSQWSAFLSTAFPNSFSIFLCCSFLPCGDTGQLWHSPLQPLRLQSPVGPPSPWCSLPGWGKFLLSQLPPRDVGPLLIPYLLVSFVLLVIKRFSENLSYSFGWMRSSGSFQWIFCENCPTCRCIFHISTSLTLPSWYPSWNH